MELGYAPLMYPPTAFSQAFSDIGACRYDGVDLVLGKVHEVGVDTVADLLRKYDLSPVCIVAGWLDDADTVEMIVDSLPSVADLGATYLGVIPPRRSHSSLDTFHDRLDTILDRCRDCGVTPVVHHHAGSLIETPADIERFLSVRDVDVLFDTAHYDLYGECQAGVDRFGNRIAHVHLKDLIPTTSPAYFEACVDEFDAEHPNFDSIVTVYRSFTDLGEGRIPLEATCTALVDQGYDGAITVEVENQTHDPLIHAKWNADVARQLVDR